MESATIPEEGFPDFFQKAEFAFVPSVSAVIVNAVVLGVGVVLEEHPLIVSEPYIRRIAQEAIGMILVMIFLKMGELVADNFS